MYVYTCIYAHIHICICMYVHDIVYAYTHTHTHTHTHKHMQVKENKRNASLLVEDLSVLRAQLGKGILVTPTLREIFVGNRPLLDSISKDFILQIIALLPSRQPQYVDFLMSICSCTGEPIVRNQHMITEHFLVGNQHFLPATYVEGVSETGSSESQHLTVSIQLDSQEPRIDLSQFCATVPGKSGELADHVMNAPLRELGKKQKAFRYYTRCINLFGKLAMGRNVQALQELVSRKEFSFRNLMALFRAKNVPSLLKGRYMDLMTNLWVVRDPQCPTPHILLTRTWSQLEHSQAESRANSQLAKRQVPLSLTLPPPPPPPCLSFSLSFLSLSVPLFLSSLTFCFPLSLFSLFFSL